MGYKTDYHLNDHINQKIKVLFNQLLCITMKLYVHFTSTINQYRFDLELQNIISLYWTYDLELGCDAVLLPKPKTVATLNCKIPLPCIGTHDLVLGCDIVLPKPNTGATLNFKMLQPCIGK